MVLKFEYDKEAMDVCQKHTINAVENGRMPKLSSTKLFIFHKIPLFVTDKLRGKTPRERSMAHQPYLTSQKRGFGLVSAANKGHWCQNV